MNFEKHKLALKFFYLLGTILLAYVTVDTIIDMFFYHTTWLYRPGWAQKAVVLVIMLDFILMTLVSIASTVSLFLNKDYWKPLTKGIIINIIALIIFCTISSILFRIL